VVEFGVNRENSLHSRARRVVASTAAGFVTPVEGRNFGVEGNSNGDLIFVKGDVSINDGTSTNAANPPDVNSML